MMLRKLFGLALVCLLPMGLGCAMCCGTDDYNYAAYGGHWQRHDMSHGRVGSVFAEAGFDALAEEPLDAYPSEGEYDGNENGEDYVPGDDNLTGSDSTRTELATFIR